jgi:outer membrane protein assembly factor BamB
MKINRILFFTLMVISFFLPSCIALESLRINAIPKYALEENGEYIVIWNRTGIGMNPNDRRPAMVGGPGRIIVDGRKNLPLALTKIYGLDSLSGEDVWEISNAGGGQLIIEEEYLYFGAAGWAKVISYNIENGELVWSTSLPWAHSVTDLYFAQNKIFAHTNDSEFFVLSDDGEILNNFSETFRVFLETNNILYMEALFSVKAVDASSKKEIWHLKLDDKYTHAPIFDNGTIFIRTWDSSSTYIYSVDQTAGVVNWKVSAEVLSNLYLAGDKFYYMSRDGFFVSADRSTGDEISRVKFSPEIDLNALTGGFFITGDAVNDIIVVSFEGNDQIMGIRVINP